MAEIRVKIRYYSTVLCVIGISLILSCKSSSRYTRPSYKKAEDKNIPSKKKKTIPPKKEDIVNGKTTELSAKGHIDVIPSIVEAHQWDSLKIDNVEYEEIQVKTVRDKRVVYIKRTYLFDIIEDYLGVRYKFGGVTRRGMDCSGLVWAVFKDLGMRKLKRVPASVLYEKSTSIKFAQGLQGDLVFFKEKGRIFHVGIYMGGDIFVHASTRHGVTYSSLNNRYFKTRFAGIRRLF